jgi:hypothetical protein
VSQGDATWCHVLLFVVVLNIFRWVVRWVGREEISQRCRTSSWHPGGPQGLFAVSLFRRELVGDESQLAVVAGVAHGPTLEAKAPIGLVSGNTEGRGTKASRPSRSLCLSWQCAPACLSVCLSICRLSVQEKVGAHSSALRHSTSQRKALRIYLGLEKRDQFQF